MNHPIYNFDVRNLINKREVRMKQLQRPFICLVEKSHAHVRVGVRLWFGSLLLGLLFGLAASGRGTGRSTRGDWGATTSRNVGKLGTASLHHLENVLAAQLLNDDVKLSAVDFDSNGAKDFREVSCRWTGVSAHNGQDVSSHVTHFELILSRKDTKRVIGSRCK